MEHSPRASTSGESSSPSINTPRNLSPRLSRSCSPTIATNQRGTGRSVSPATVSSDVDELDSDNDDLRQHLSKPVAKKRRTKGQQPTSSTALNPAGLPPISSHYDPSLLTVAQCQWNGCGRQFYELEPLIDHLHNHGKAHSFNSKGSAIYSCEWIGCPRKGKNQNSKFALIGHLRSHTGEKPFICPRPECDKSFTRTDALQKHMRIQHGDNILPSRKPPTKKRKSTHRSGSVDSDNAPAAQHEDDASSVGGGEDGAPEEPEWQTDELEMFEQNPSMDQELLAYLLLKAKWRASLQEHEVLVNELEAHAVREAELGAECDELIRLILRKEVGESLELGQFLDAYNHEPTPMPIGWTGESGPVARALLSQSAQ